MPSFMRWCHTLKVHRLLMYWWLLRQNHLYKLLRIGTTKTKGLSNLLNTPKLRCFWIGYIIRVTATLPPTASCDNPSEAQFPHTSCNTLHAPSLIGVVNMEHVVSCGARGLLVHKPLHVVHSDHNKKLHNVHLYFVWWREFTHAVNDVKTPCSELIELSLYL